MVAALHPEATLNDPAGKVSRNYEFVLAALLSPVVDNFPERVGRYHRPIGLTGRLARPGSQHVGIFVPGSSAIGILDIVIDYRIRPLKLVGARQYGTVEKRVTIRENQDRRGLRLAELGHRVTDGALTLSINMRLVRLS